MPVRARAYAKINLLLAVGPRRPDGYHEVLSLMQSVGLHDTLDLAFVPAEAPSIHFRCTHPEVPHDDRNLVFRAIRAFREEYGVADPLGVTLDKGIPVAAGLAGGSADAAATLVALAHLYDPPGGVHRTSQIPGWTGRGEAVARLALAVEALVAGDLVALGQSLYNDLALVTEGLRPEVREARERFLAAGAPGALMSGSGPTVFALAGSEEAAGKLAAAVQDLPGEAHLTRMVGRGVQLDAGVRRPQKETRPSGPK